MGEFVNQEKNKITEEDFFQLGFGRFISQGNENVKKVVSKKLVDFSFKNQMGVDPQFFLKMSDLGKEVWEEKLEDKKGE
jgi:hypothetical protein